MSDVSIVDLPHPVPPIAKIKLALLTSLSVLYATSRMLTRLSRETAISLILLLSSKSDCYGVVVGLPIVSPFFIFSL